MKSTIFCKLAAHKLGQNLWMRYCDEYRGSKLNCLPSPGSRSSGRKKSYFWDPPWKFTIIIFVIINLGPTHRTYFLLCAQGSLQVGLGGPYGAEDQIQGCYMQSSSTVQLRWSLKNLPFLKKQKGNNHPSNPWCWDGWKKSSGLAHLGKHWCKTNC